jgi:hypothetical protein
MKKTKANDNVQRVVNKKKKVFIELQTMLMIKAITHYLSEEAK